jgi:hypothetical protein
MTALRLPRWYAGGDEEAAGGRGRTRLPAVLARLVGPSILERTQNHTLQPGPYNVSAEAESLHRTLLVAECTPTRCYGAATFWRRARRATLICRAWCSAMSASRPSRCSPLFRAHLNIERNKDTSDLVPYIGMLQGWPLKTLRSPK